MKNLISCVIFCSITIFLIVKINNILIPKSTNRYYILEKYLEENEKEYDVNVFGSCHSYTSFNPMILEEETNITGFVYGNPGEIIPTTYLRMLEQFKKYVPEVALVEIWGINAYETYGEAEDIFGHYLKKNIELLPLSSEKTELIKEYSDMEYNNLTFLNTNFPMANYKDRILDYSLTDVDFNYYFERTEGYSSEYVFNEMTSRLSNNGFKANPSNAILDYPSKQSKVNEDDYLEIEEDIVKYLIKIIKLCEEKDVELIFYRSPYISKENELKKLNHLRDILEEYNIIFIDLEEDIEYDYETDFIDYEHLSEVGANKSTLYLADYIIDALNN